MSSTMIASKVTQRGFYMRRNLHVTDENIMSGPFNLCPDVVRAGAPIENPQNTFGTEASWGQMYEAEPGYDQENYYYVRGKNAGTSEVTRRLSLYYAPAQLIMFPSLWSSNLLRTESNSEFVSVTADPGRICVGGDALVFKNPPQLEWGGSYYGFVARMSGDDEPNPIPNVTRWLDVSELLVRNRGFVFRNTSFVDGTAQTWWRRQMLTIPEDIPSTTLILTLESGGFTEGKIGFVGDMFSSNQTAIIAGPTALGQPNVLIGSTFNVEPGFSTSIAVQYWNTSGRSPTLGSTISLTAFYPVPPDQLIKAAGRGLIDNEYNEVLQTVFNLEPQPLVVVGRCTYIVA